MDSVAVALDMAWLAPALVGPAVGGLLLLAIVVIWRFPGLAVLDVRLGPFRLRMVNRPTKKEE